MILRLLRRAVAVITRHRCGDVLGLHAGSNFYKVDATSIVCGRFAGHGGPHCCANWRPVLRYLDGQEVPHFESGPGVLYWYDDTRASVSPHREPSLAIVELPAATARDRRPN